MGDQPVEDPAGNVEGILATVGNGDVCHRDDRVD
jgi:hypothetical protein